MTREQLSDVLYKAALEAFTRLFSNGEHYYYASLLVGSEGHRPFVSAWSDEALERERQAAGQASEYCELVRWSYADSPYCDFSAASFSDVEALFSDRPGIDRLSLEEWNEELLFRIDVMEAAVRKLDESGIFSMNQERDAILVNVELVPPDYSNTLRAQRLNSESNRSLVRWLREAAEESA